MISSLYKYSSLYQYLDWPRQLVAAALVFLPVLFAPTFPVAAAERSTLEIVGKSGVHVFTVDFASNDEERSRGLMYRRELPQGQGMLFDFKRDQDVAFWMKNTYIPLDMIFIRGDGRISRIVENTTPESLQTIPSGGPVRAVLEVIGGTAKKLGIVPGDRVAHPIFSIH